MTDDPKTTPSLIAKKLRYKELVEKLRTDGKLSPREVEELSRLERAIKNVASQSDGLSERERQRRLMSKKRHAERDIEIDYSRQNKRRRAKYRDDPAGFCMKYFPKTFYNPFCEHHFEIIKAITNAIKYSQLAAIAAPRGEGKSSLVKVVAGVWAIVYGHAKWFVPIEATFDEAQLTLADIKSYYEDEEGEDLFGADFPEVCIPIRAMEGSSRRSEGQTVNGKPTKIKWGTTFIRMPEVEGSNASGAMITPKSAEKAIRGLAQKDKRPDIVLLNDLETDETVRSWAVTHKIKENIEKGVLGLAGQSRGLGVVMVGTIINARCLIAQYTDTSKNPIWNGKRYRFFNQWPSNKELWDKYLYIRQRDGVSASNAFYLQNRQSMDEGADVSNKSRFSKEKGPDGKRLEHSAIQRGYNEIAKMGFAAFMSEYQNDPIADENDAAELKSDVIVAKLNHIPQGVILESTDKVTAYIDVHDRVLFWAVVAFRQGFIGTVIDYGHETVNSPLAGTVAKADRDKATELAVYETLKATRRMLFERYPSAAITLVDSGWRQQAVYQACREPGFGMTFPAKGLAGQSYKTPGVSAKNVRYVGKHQYQSYMPNDGIWLTIINADYYKRLVQEGFRVEDWDKPGSMSLFGDDAFIHNGIAEHIVDEQWNFEKGKFEGLGGKQAKNNHWLDCLAGCCAGAAMCGIKLIEQAKQIVPARKPIQPVTGDVNIRTRY